MNPIGTKELFTSHLTLRKIRPSDAAELYAAGVLGASPEEAEATVANMIRYNDDGMNFHWILEYEGRAVGRIKAWEVNPRDDFAQLGYDIGENYRSRGLMTEAVRAVCAFLLTEGGFNRVYCMVRETNLPSRRVCEKSGMTFEATLRRHFRQPDGSYVDVRVYGILAGELPRS